MKSGWRPQACVEKSPGSIEPGLSGQSGITKKYLVTGRRPNQR